MMLGMNSGSLGTGVDGSDSGECILVQSGATRNRKTS